MTMTMTHPHCIVVLRSCSCCCHWHTVIFAIMLYCCILFFMLFFLFLFLLLLLLSVACHQCLLLCHCPSVIIQCHPLAPSCCNHGVLLFCLFHIVSHCVALCCIVSQNYPTIYERSRKIWKNICFCLQ